MEKTLFYDVSDLFGDPEEVIAAAADCAEKNGISGNAVANYISYKLLTSENAFSLCAEKGLADKTISALALSDVKKVIAAYNRIKSYADEIFGGSVTDYRAGEEKNTYAANRIGRLGGALVKAGEKAENGDETAAAKEAMIVVPKLLTSPCTARIPRFMIDCCKHVRAEKLVISFMRDLRRRILPSRQSR